MLTSSSYQLAPPSGVPSRYQSRQSPDIASPSLAKNAPTLAEAGKSLVPSGAFVPLFGQSHNREGGVGWFDARRSRNLLKLFPASYQPSYIEGLPPS